MSKILQAKYSQSRELYERGLSVQECSDYFDITRQSMHKILKKRDTVFRPPFRFGRDSRLYRGTKADKRAHLHLARAIKKGVIVKPMICSRCQGSGLTEEDVNILVGHHDDYGKPLWVRWLCPKCHHDWHKTNKAKNNLAKEYKE